MNEIETAISTTDSDESIKDEKKDEVNIEFKSHAFEVGYYRIKEKLKEIEMLEERDRCGFFLFPTQFKKIAKRDEYEKTINEIKNGTWIPPPIVVKKEVNDEDEVDNDDNDDDGNNKDKDDPFNVLDDLLDLGYKVVANKEINANLNIKDVNDQQNDK